MVLKTVRIGKCPRCGRMTFFARIKIVKGKRYKQYFCTMCGYNYMREDF